MPGQSGVPGVGVDDVDTGRGVRHAQFGGERRQGRVGSGESGVGRVDDRAFARGAHAVHVDLAQPFHLSDELGYVYSCAAVDLRRVFLGHHRDSHALNLTARGRSGYRSRYPRPFGGGHDRTSRTASLAGVHQCG